MAFLHVENIQRSLPVNFQYSSKWVLQMMWNNSVCARSSGNVLNWSVSNWQVERPLPFRIIWELDPFTHSQTELLRDQGSPESLFTSTSWVLKGYKTDKWWPEGTTLEEDYVDVLFNHHVDKAIFFGQVICRIYRCVRHTRCQWSWISLR